MSFLLARGAQNSLAASSRVTAFVDYKKNLMNFAESEVSIFFLFPFPRHFEELLEVVETIYPLSYFSMVSWIELSPHQR